MNTDELKNNFEQITSFWENALNEYSEGNFALKENEENWSVGQVYEHLISTSGRIFILTERLSKTNDNYLEEKSETGKAVFKNNELANKKTKVPTVLQAQPVQPVNKVQVKKELSQLKERFPAVYELAKRAEYNGKYEHQVLGFLNAMEWLQFTEMHFRHHLHQKERIDAFLKTSGA